MRATRTTTNLTLPRAPRWLGATPPALTIAIAVLLVAALISGVKTVQLYRPQVPAVPTPALQSAPIIVFKQAPTPALATPDMQLRLEVEQLRDRLAALEAERLAAPIQQQTNAEMPAAPIVAPGQQIQIDNAQPPAQQPEAQPAPTQAPKPQPTAAPPAVAPNQPGDVERAWAIESWREEHCLADRCY